MGDGQQGRGPGAAIQAPAPFGPLQLYGLTVVLTAGSSVDGMCRPPGYQAFVFVGGKLVGTLAQADGLTHRTDGALTSFRLVSADHHLSAEFSRYTESNPLCCPSRVSSVTYRIRRRERGPVLGPASVSTNPGSR